MKNVYYCGCYLSEDISERKPLGSYAAKYKMDYIKSVLKRLGYHVTLISYYTAQVRGLNQAKTVVKDERETRIYLPSYEFNRKLHKLSAILRLLIVTIYMVCKFKSKDTVIVYNLQEISIPTRIAKTLKGFTLILEIEELYFEEVAGSRKEKRKKIEMKLVEAADKYLVVNDIIQREYLSSAKKAIVSYGGYVCPPKMAERINDGRIHVVYAGVVDEIRGAFRIVECAGYLSEKYAVHILGFGSEDMLTLLNEEISRVNAKCAEQKIIYHGAKSGNELSVFLQSYHIGVNAQIVGERFERVSYPSKIPSYFSHGLNVVSSRVSSVMESKFSPYVTYYDSNNAEELADAIERVQICSYEQQVKVIQSLDINFTEALLGLLESDAHGA